jgi:PKD repeat protein
MTKKMSIAWIFVLLVLIPLATASQESISTFKPEIQELPELDMTGLETDIELIEVDPEIIGATDDWMILAHDDAGKQSLVEDIDHFSLSEYDRSDLKATVNELWTIYPTKFVSAGEKTIEVTIPSEGSEKIISVPVGHVTRIEFDRKKIKETAQGKNLPRAQMLASIKSSTKIALTENENETIKNITRLREKLYKQSLSSNKISSEGATLTTESTTSFSGGSSFTSGMSSSGFISNPEFTSSVKKESGYSGRGLMAWSGSPEPLKGEDTTSFHNYPALYTGHNGIIYLSCNKMGCTQTYSLNAADAAMDPDSWEPSPETCQVNMVPFASMILPAVAEEKWKLLIHSCNHYYDPLVGELGSGAAPVYVKKYADMAKNNNTINDIESAKQLGQASHFLTDVSLPTHTGTELPQVLERISGYPRDTHNWYEFYLNDLWNNPSKYKLPASRKTIKQIIEEDAEYYSFTNPEAATKNLARFSNSYSDTLYYKIRNLPVQIDGNNATIPGTGFYADTTVENITKNQVLAATRYSSGLVRYVRSDAIKVIPIADFDVAQNPVCNSPYDFLFHEKTHLTFGGSYSYKWDFGDGYTKTAGDYDFTHQYSSTGVFPVSYKVWNTVNGPNNAIEKTMDVYAGACPPSAEFDIISDFGSKPYTFRFEDKSTGGTPTSWQWSFGDETPGSNLQNPTHTFDTVRQFYVSLVVSNQYGDSFNTKRVEINRPRSFAVVDVDKKIGYVPLTITVKDISRCWETANEFDAGDGSPIVYNQTEFIHTYQNTGTYYANLTVRNDLGSNTNTTKIIVMVPPPLANFTASPRAGTAPLTVQFTDTSTGSPTGWTWDFGDGNTTTTPVRNITHIYVANGSYNVTLTATNGGGSNTTTKIRYIRVGQQDAVGVFRPSTHSFYLRPADWPTTPATAINWGVETDIPLTGDWDGDDETEVGVYRCSTHSFYLRPSDWPTTPAMTEVWGIDGDIPLIGDWEGDGESDVGIFRPSTHLFYLKPSDYPSSPATIINWGIGSDIPVTGDWDGNGITDVGVYRPSTHSFHLRPSNWPTSPAITVVWGIDGDIPFTGDWNGDGAAEVGIFRPSTHSFYIRPSDYPTTPATIINWGIVSDIPVIGKWS